MHLGVTGIVIALVLLSMDLPANQSLLRFGRRAKLRVRAVTGAIQASGAIIRAVLIPTLVCLAASPSPSAAKDIPPPGARLQPAPRPGVRLLPTPLPPPTQSREQWRQLMAKKPAPKGGCYTSSYPDTEWHEVPCTTAPPLPHAPVGGMTPVTKQWYDDVIRRHPEWESSITTSPGNVMMTIARPFLDAMKLANISVSDVVKVVLDNANGCLDFLPARDKPVYVTVYGQELSVEKAGRQIRHRYTTDQSAFLVKVDNYRPNSVACSQIPITDPAKLPKPPKNGLALSGGERSINAAVMATRIGHGAGLLFCAGRPVRRAVKHTHGLPMAMPER
jgi:hypothetical protein